MLSLSWQCKTVIVLKIFDLNRIVFFFSSSVFMNRRSLIKIQLVKSQNQMEENDQQPHSEDESEERNSKMRRDLEVFKRLMGIKDEKRNSAEGGSSLKDGDMVTKWLAPKLRKKFGRLVE